MQQSWHPKRESRYEKHSAQAVPVSTRGFAPVLIDTSLTREILRIGGTFGENIEDVNVWKEVAYSYPYCSTIISFYKALFQCH